MVNLWATPELLLKWHVKMSAVRNRCRRRQTTDDITAVFPSAVTLPTCLHVNDSYSALAGQLAVRGRIIRRWLWLLWVSITQPLRSHKHKLWCLLFLKKHQKLFFRDLKKPRHWLWTWLHQKNFKMIRESTQKRDGRFFFFPRLIWQIRVKASMFARSTVECVHLLRFIRQK